jgi:hypothetical protein
MENRVERMEKQELERRDVAMRRDSKEKKKKKKKTEATYGEKGKRSRAILERAREAADSLSLLFGALFRGKELYDKDMGLRWEGVQFGWEEESKQEKSKGGDTDKGPTKAILELSGRKNSAVQGGDKLKSAYLVAGMPTRPLERLWAWWNRKGRPEKGKVCEHYNAASWMARQVKNTLGKDKDKGKEWFPETGFRTHLLRKAGAFHLKRKGVPEESMRRIGGWKHFNSMKAYLEGEVETIFEDLRR